MRLVKFSGLEEGLAHFGGKGFFILKLPTITSRRGFDLLQGMVLFGVYVVLSSEPRIVFDDDLQLSDLVDFAVVEVDFLQKWIHCLLLFVVESRAGTFE